MLELAEGIGAIGMLRRCDAVLSGYLGSPAQAQAVVEIVRAVKATNPHAWYFCDPVMGQDGDGAMEPGVDAYLVKTMPALADGLAPNHRELQKLVGRTIETVDEAALARPELVPRSARGSLV